MTYHHFTSAEQLELEILLERGLSNREIARSLDCHHTTIGRERKRNSVRKKYKGKDAKLKARLRRRQSKYQGMKVRKRPDLQEFIIEKLNEGWTPEAIAGRLKKKRKDLPYVSAKGIYKWLYSVHGQKYCALLCSQQLKPKKHRPKAERSMIPNRVGIEERPEEANNRSEYGHYETDTAVSGRCHDTTAALAVLLERKTRFVCLEKIPNMKPASMTRAIKRMAKDLAMDSITYDNGIENRGHENVAASLEIKTYFCNKYCSWEKGGVENIIGRVRRSIPKGSDFSKYSKKKIAAIAHRLNHTPRECLDWDTPYERMVANHMFLSSTSPNLSGALEG